MTIEPLTKLNEKFLTSDLVRTEAHGKKVRERPTFSTVAGVKRLLSRMGLKQ